MGNLIDVVVVTYNRLPLLKECLNSLLEQRENLARVFVINNKSTDGTTDYLNSLNDPLIDVTTLDANIGGAAGFEYGVNLAMVKGDGRYVWIMDDDTIPDKEASFELLNKAEVLNNDFGFLCSNVRWTDGSATNIAHVSSDWPDRVKDGLVGVKSATFVSVFIQKNSINNVGLPLGKMQIWGDDTEYTTRLSSYKKSFFVAECIAVHKTTYNLMQDSLRGIQSERIWRFKAMYRNLIYIKRHYARNKDVLKMVLANFVTGLGALKAKDHRFKRLSAAISGTINGFFFNPTVNFPDKDSIEEKTDA